MSKVITSIFLKATILILISGLLCIQATPINKKKAVKTFPSLPASYKENKFKQIETAFEERANLFLKGRHFHNYTANKSKKELLDEFQSIKEWRHHTWYSDETSDTLISRSEFLVSQDLLEKGLYRRAHILAFDYNHSGCSYNASNIVLNGYRFLAMEGPTNKNLDRFFKLLQNYHVTQVVRLTPEKEGESEKCFPYWEGRVQQDDKTKTEFFNLPLEGTTSTYPVRYYAIDTWLDYQGVSPQVLLNLINKVRNETDYNNGLIACHCAGGVGRTGTLIAGYLILEEIDRQLNELHHTPDNIDISIEKIVMQLSLQRSRMVATSDQYVSLHRLADLYLETIKKKNQKISKSKAHKVKPV